MSTTCPRSFTITVTNPVVPPVVYYKMDAFGGGNSLIDSGPNGLDTNGTWGTATIVAGKITNAVRWGAGGAKQRYIAPGDAALNLSGKSYTIRFWARVVTDVTNYHALVTPGNNSIIRLAPAGIAVGPPYVGPPPTGPYSRNRPYWAYSGGVSWTTWSEPTTSATPMSDLQWHRIIVTWNFTTKATSIRIDNNADAVITATGEPTWIGSLTFNQTTNPANQVEMCELGIWDYEWDEAKKTSDWNSGNGQTYP